jgi:hypothetical protein
VTLVFQARSYAEMVQVCLEENAYYKPISIRYAGEFDAIKKQLTALGSCYPTYTSFDFVKFLQDLTGFKS